MAYFIECSVDKVKYLRGEYIKNNPINIDLCQEMLKKQYSWYPDNEGLPCIKFVGLNTEWVFKTEKDRDKELKSIINKINFYKIEKLILSESDILVLKLPAYVPQEGKIRLQDNLYHILRKAGYDNKIIILENECKFEKITKE